MSGPLQTQLRDYGAFVDEEQGAVDITTIVERRIVEQPARPSQPPAPQTLAPLPRVEDDTDGSRPSRWATHSPARLPTMFRRPRAIAAVLSAAVVALAIVLPVLLLSGGTERGVGTGGGDAPVATQPPAPVATPAPTFSSLTWSRASLDDAIFGGAFMTSVAAAGPELIAVGGGGAHTAGDAAVWTSVDGVTWSRVPDDDPSIFGGSGEQWMNSVTVGGPGLVAVGWELSGFDADAAVWTSPDGITWSRVPHDEEVFGGGSHQAMNSVTAGGPGVVAIGGDRSRNPDDGDAAVWTSVDGITWSRVPHDEEVFGEAEMSSVTVGGPGLVAVGGDSEGAAVWTSVDGLSWSRVPEQDSLLRGGMSAVTAGGPGLVAVGRSRSSEDDTDSAAAWTSVDGLSWSRVPDQDSLLRGEMSAVTVGGPGLVAVGGDSAVWTSVDGITWSRVPDDEAVFGGANMTSVAAAGPELIAVGGDDAGAAVWVAATED